VTAKIYHADLYGSRAHKYKTLLDSSLQDIDWQELSPNTPFYLFVPQEQLHREQYDAWPKITDVFPVNSVGIVTARDKLAIRFTEQEVWETAKDFAALPVETAREKYKLGPDARDWKVTLAQKDLNTSGKTHSLSKANIMPVLYRPFDTRYTYYTGHSRGFLCMPRNDVMRHMLAGKNVALITSRMTKGEAFQHLQATRSIVEVICMSPKTSNNGFVFPLWLYPKEGTLEQHAERQPNLAPAFLQALQHAIGHPPTPEDVFHYAYAIFHAPTYRTRYAPFLKTDFPRLPLPPNADAFQTLAALGSKLVALHLLEDPALAKHGIGFPIAGDHTVQKMKDAARYTPPAQGGTKGRVKLNATEYFDNVPLAAWEFQVGGYRPASKWLADREGRRLTAPDIDHYRRTLAALRETAALLPQVDAAFTAAFPLPAAAQ